MSEQCPSCERSFETRQGLGKHHSYVHGESMKEYESGDATEDCPICDDSFTTRSGLGIHMSKLHEQTLKEYESTGDKRCPSCDRIFETRQGLGQHHSAKHGESINEYESTGIECPKGCGTYKDLAIHWSWIHDEPFPVGVKRQSEERESRRIDEICGKNHYLYGDGENISDITRARMSRTLTGRTFTEKHKNKISEELTGRNLSEDHKQKMIESKTGTTLSEEHKRKISEAKTGHIQSEETIQKRVDSRNSWGTTKLCVVPTKHEVASSWEKEIDILLYDSEFEYEYEPQQYDIGNRSYIPDFKVGMNIIEVKGYWGDSEREELFMEHHPEYRYIVVGTERPSDVWIPWKERESLINVLD